VDVIRIEFSLGSIITVGAVGGVGGDFSHTAPRSSAI